MDVPKMKVRLLTPHCPELGKPGTVIEVDAPRGHRLAGCGMAEIVEHEAARAGAHLVKPREEKGADDAGQDSQG